MGQDEPGAPSAGDLRELPRVPLRGEGSCGSRLNICYYHQDLHLRRLHPGPRPRLQGSPQRPGPAVGGGGPSPPRGWAGFQRGNRLPPTLPAPFPPLLGRPAGQPRLPGWAGQQGGSDRPREAGAACAAARAHPPCPARPLLPLGLRVSQPSSLACEAARVRPALTCFPGSRRQGWVRPALGVLPEQRWPRGQSRGPLPSRPGCTPAPSAAEKFPILVSLVRLPTQLAGPCGNSTTLRSLLDCPPDLISLATQPLLDGH